MHMPHMYISIIMLLTDVIRIVTLLLSRICLHYKSAPPRCQARRGRIRSFHILIRKAHTNSCENAQHM